MALQFFASAELDPGADCVFVNETEGGLRVTTGQSQKDGVEPRVWEEEVMRLEILLDPDAWRQSASYRAWRGMGFFNAGAFGAGAASEVGHV